MNPYGWPTLISDFSQSQDNKNLSQTTTSDKRLSPLFSLFFL